MKFLSVGGELNHHGKYMCDCMYELLGNQYRRISTSFVNKTRKELGYRDELDVPYNIDGSHYSDNDIAEAISWADVIDYGFAPESYLHEAVKQNKIVFIRIERLLKEGDWKLLIPTILHKYWRKYRQYRNNKHVYYLCVSAYAARDLKKLGITGQRVLQWAYCPEFVEYSRCKEIDANKDIIKLLWCGRMIKWKHPEIAVYIAEELNKRGLHFKLVMAGVGDQEDSLKRTIREKKLNEYVEVVGPIQADKMRETMRTMDVFVATSDRNEGWGVVINEAMNSECAVVASEEMGSVPVLIRNGKNGFYFKWYNYKKAADYIEKLYKDRELLRDIQISAYTTIKECYNPHIYARTFYEIAYEAIAGEVQSRQGLGEYAIIR